MLFVVIITIINTKSFIFLVFLIYDYSFERNVYYFVLFVELFVYGCVVYNWVYLVMYAYRI